MASFKNILNVLWVMLIFIGSASAQNRYIVHFTDKNSSPYKISEPGQFLSPRAISRRLEQDIAITTDDLPVNPSYVQQLKTSGASVFYTSRWMNCALIQATPEVAASLSALSFVKQVDLAAPGTRIASGRTKSPKSRKQTSIAEATKRQLEMIDIDDMHAEDITGDGILVALLDAGFDGVDTAEPFQHLFTNNKIADVHDFVQNTKDVYRYDDHGTEVFSVIAGSSSTYTGGAYDATFQLYVTEDVPTEYRIEEYNWLFAAERADSSGVDVISSSLGYNTFDDKTMDYSKADLTGKVAIISRAAALALDRGIVVICSAGNEAGNSWGTITPPADVDGIIAVGGITSQGAKSPFSSVGPSADGRIKPDVVVLGSGVSVVKANGSNGFTSGTSVAAPIVTSLAIGLIQKYPDIDPNTIAHTILATSDRSAHPDNSFGYGIPSYVQAKAALEDLVPLEEITVYPNPTDTGRFSVRFKTPGIQASIIVYDLNGRVLSSHTVDVTPGNNPIEINVADLPASSYLVKVKTSDNFKAFRLVKL